MKKIILTLIVAISATAAAWAAGSVTSASGPFGSTVLTLSNGLKVYLRPGPQDGHEVEITAYAPKGFASDYNPARESTYRAAGDVLGISKVGGVSASQLRRDLKTRGIKANLELDNYVSEINVQAPDSALTYALSLVKTYATGISPDTAALHRWSDTKLRMFDSPKRNAVVAMGDSIHATVYRRHPLGAKLNRTDVEHLDYADIMKLYKQIFGNMADFTIIITGAQDTEANRRLIADTLGTLPVSRKKTKTVNVDYGYHSGDTLLEYTFPAANTPQTIVYTFRSADAPFTLSNLLTSRSFGVIYRQRLIKALQEEIGANKDITSHCAVVDGINGKYSGAKMILPCYIKCSHGSEAKVAATVDAILEDMAANGPTPQEVEAERLRLTREYNSLTDNIGYWQTVIRKYLTTGIDIDSQYLATVQSMTPQSMRQFIGTYIQPARPLRMIMRPK